VTHVRDGDTIVIAGQAVRLNGVDAPELRDNWGASSSAAMRVMVHGRTVRCALNGERTHDRVVGICYLDDGRDIGREMIRQGLALDCRKFSGGRYHDDETYAARLLLRRAPYC
jgi:endonuclease YncB( thermonuclease family)